MNVDAFKDVRLANDPTVYTTMYRAPNPPFTYVLPASELVSLAVPSLLFDEVSLRKPRTEFPRPPVMESPSL
jgi:hypothetical protein